MPLIEEYLSGRIADLWLADNPHVWIGTTVENQEMADKRIPILLTIPARIRFLSCEPLLGPVDLDVVKMTGRSGRITVCPRANQPGMRV